jgi:hypothetical protein
MIENFFGLVNDQVVTMPTPEQSDIDFDTLLSSIETTKGFCSNYVEPATLCNARSQSVPALPQNEDSQTKTFLPFCS